MEARDREEQDHPRQLNADSSHGASPVSFADGIPATATHAPRDSGVPFDARDMSVKDRVVIISGAGQGIGRELARQFAAAGARVVVADVNAANADRVQNEIARADGDAMAATVDIGNEESLEAMVSTVLAKYGRTDVLINGAAIFATLRKRPFDQIPLDEWNRVLHVNITGTFLSVRAVLPAMRAAKWGRIINISSNSVRKGVPNYLHYVTSKSAIIGMTNAMARELGADGITVNCIRPGAVATEVERAVNPTIERRIAQVAEQCIPRGMVPPDLVGLAMFLSTPAASFMTGQTIACDGGMTHSS
ncbi:MAG TPA: SDR family oxidoreductase [Alphaproteobacteria bacterium]|nr:SDR family oxidoreductase [Alphaproteobacteria bacterium]